MHTYEQDVVLKKKQKTRIVCVSDTHGASPRDGGFSLPEGDVLIHAGDLSNQGSYSALQRTSEWIASADFKVKIVVAGNHDTTLDTTFHAAHSTNYKEVDPQSTEASIALFDSNPSITYLCHSSKTIHLPSSDGTITRFRVFGSPFSPTRAPGAFSYAPCPSGAHTQSLLPLSAAHPLALPSARWGRWRDANADTDADSKLEAEHLWAAIPLDTDVVVTHTPSYGILDTDPLHPLPASASTGPWSCPALRRRLWEVRPALHVHGHMHAGRGAEIVRWGADQLRPGDIVSRRVWCQPGLSSGAAMAGVQGKKGRKMSLMDLTGRCWKGEAGDEDGVLARPLDNDFCDSNYESRRQGRAADEAFGVMENHYSFSATTAGGHATTRRGRLHHETLSCWQARQGRAETAVVNAAIMAKRYGASGGKRFNPAVVVDMYLPVWTGHGEDQKEDYRNDYDNEDEAWTAATAAAAASVADSDRYGKHLEGAALQDEDKEPDQGQVDTILDSKAVIVNADALLFAVEAVVFRAVIEAVLEATIQP